MTRTLFDVNANMSPTHWTSFLFLVYFLVAAAVRHDVDAYLFPDLSIRTGRSASHYKIGALKEAPFVYQNGSGYVSELMSMIADTYKQLHHDDDELPYELVGVDVWQQLAEKAQHSHRQVAFGLICPTLLRSDWTWKEWYASTPVVWTSLKLLVHTTPPVAPVEKDRLDGRSHARKHMPRRILVTRDTTEDHVLAMSSRYRPTTLVVDTLNDALLISREVDDFAVMTDSIVADTVAKQSGGLLRSVCPGGRRAPGSNTLYYGFFGKDITIINSLIHVINHMTKHGTLDQLNERFFADVSQCP